MAGIPKCRLLLPLRPFPVGKEGVHGLGFDCGAARLVVGGQRLDGGGFTEAGGLVAGHHARLVLLVDAAPPGGVYAVGRRGLRRGFGGKRVDPAAVLLDLLLDVDGGPARLVWCSPALLRRTVAVQSLGRAVYGPVRGGETGLDAAVGPGDIAVLLTGHTAEGGRLIHLLGYPGGYCRETRKKGE